MTTPSLNIGCLCSLLQALIFHLLKKVSRNVYITISPRCIFLGDQQQGNQSWLHNLSYAPPSRSIESSSSSDSDCSYTPVLKKKSTHPVTKPKPQQSQSDTDVYRIDRKSDPDNLRYDTVYSGSVSVYRRRFECLGLGAKYKLKWNDGRSKLSKRQRKKRLGGELRYFTDRLKHTASEVNIPRKLTHSGVNTLSEFVEIGREASIKEDVEDDSLTVERYMSKLTAEYSNSLLEQPHNVDLWMEFLTFQDQLMEWGHLAGEGGDFRARKKQAIAERKMSIYERALEQNPVSEELLMGYMSLVREKWDTDKMIKRWKDLVFQQPNRPVLWLGYIHFCQTNFSSFRTSSLNSLYSKCITTLASIVEGTLKSHLPLPRTPAYMLTIFSLYCSHLKQVGLTEKAVASYQALIEFNLCVPPEVEGEDVSLEALKKFLEPFWDSGAPRFGESGALGWSNWTRKSKDKAVTVQPLGLLPAKLMSFEKGEQGNVEEEEETEIALVSGLPVPQAWLELEDHRIIHNCFPWQPNVSKGETIDDCADPDRIITFDDVSQTLFRITDPDLKLNMVFSFLNFLGAPIHSPAQFYLGGDPSSCLESVHEISPITCTLLDSGSEACRSGLLSSGLGLTSLFTSSCSLMEMASSLSTQALSCFPLSRLATRTRDVNYFISSVCNHALTLFPTKQTQTTLAQLWLVHLHSQLLNKFNSSQDCDQPLSSIKTETRAIEKLWKELLRLEYHRNNFSLWNTYALFHYSLGNFKETKKLYKSILAQEYRPNSSLCCCLCECFLGLRWSLSGEKGVAGINHNLALHALICLVEGKNSPAETVSPARLLKARTHFPTFSTKSAMDSADDVLCYCYFEYLTRGLTEACNILDRWKLRLSTEDMTEEKGNLLKIIYMKQLQLLEHHAHSHSVQPSISRDLLRSALEIFPEEPGFMAVFVRHEQQTFISGRMRRYFDKAAEESRSALPWLFSLLAELDRYARVTGRIRGDGDEGGELVDEMSVGTLCRVTSVLSRATASDTGRYCPLLWRLFMAVQVGCCTTIA